MVFARRPDDIFGEKRLLFCFQVKQVILFLDAQYIGVFPEWEFKKFGEGLEMFGILWARWVFNPHVKRWRDADANGIQIQHSDGVTWERWRDESGFCRPCCERSPDGCTVNHNVIFDANVLE